MCITESLCSTPETNTTLYINYTLIKKQKNLNVRQTHQVRSCYGLNVCVPPDSYVELLTLNVTVVGGGASGRW